MSRPQLVSHCPTSVLKICPRGVCALFQQPCPAPPRKKPSNQGPSRARKGQQTFRWSGEYPTTAVLAPLLNCPFWGKDRAAPVLHETDMPGLDTAQILCTCCHMMPTRTYPCLCPPAMIYARRGALAASHSVGFRPGAPILSGCIDPLGGGGVRAVASDGPGTPMLRSYRDCTPNTHICDEFWAARAFLRCGHI